MNKVHSIYISVPWFRFTLKDLALRVLFHQFQIMFDRIRLTFSVSTRINKLLVNLNERLNNIILERTIKNHGRFPSDKTRRVSSVACGSFVAEGERVDLQLCFRTYSHTYFPIKGIDKCQQQWFLTASFSNRKKRTKFTTYTTYFLQRIERTIAKQSKSPGQSRSQVVSCYLPRSTHRPIDDKEFEKSRLNPY